jgi:hypothetical protein
MTPSKRPPAYVAALKIPATILCLFGTVLAAYYFFYVTLHQTYLIERNFRLLATLGDQLVASIDNDQRVLQSLLVGNRDQEGSRLVDWSSQPPLIQRRVANFIPFLRSAEIVVDWSSFNHTFVLQLVEPESRLLWMRRNDALAKAGGAGVVKLELVDLLEPLLRVEAGKGIFGALLIAAPDGRVLFQTGDEKLRIAHLDRLTHRADGKTPERTFQGLADSPSMVDVLVSGSQYNLFTQPCCGQMSRDPAPTPASGDGWVLCGLTAQRTLSADSYAVSFSILILLSATLFFGLLSWPFLKLMLLGEGQRVKAHDIVLVAICTLVGMSLMTIGALDFFAYSRRLQTALDDQLRLLAIDVDAQTTSEIDSASTELDRLQRVVAELPAGHDPNLAHSDKLFDGDTLDAYPFFDSFSLIDEGGVQQQKLTLGSVGTLFVPVADREYFTHWASAPRAMKPFLESIRSATTGAREAVLSKPSSVSITDAPVEARRNYRVAALSTPLRTLIDPVVVPGFGFAVINNVGKVLFHSDPQHSLSENFFVESDGNRRLRALVGGRHMEPVDIQYWGDDYRALVFPMSVGQQWTLVTFYDKDLIRTVNVEWLILTLVLLALYAGAYVIICLGILFVRPGYRAPWLWPDPARSKEYIDLLPPLMLLSAAFAIAIAVVPVSELVVTAWLVPFLVWVLVYHSLNQSGRRGRLTVPVLIGLTTVALLLVLVLRVNDQLSRAVLVVAFGAAPVWMALARTRHASGRQSALALPVNVSHGLTAGFCVMLTAVLPAAAFFRVGHAMQIESFIKYGQLQVVLDRVKDGKRDDEVSAKQIEAFKDENLYEKNVEDRVKTLQSAQSKSKGADWGVYQSFFFSTEAVDPTKCDENNDGRGVNSEDEIAPFSESSVLPKIFEELLPFYSESSVHLRELMHDRAADRSWSWRRSGADLIFCARANMGSPFKSTVPRLFTGGPLDQVVTDSLVIVVLLSLIVSAIVWLVRFALDKVFVINVIEPLWSGSSGSLEQVWGPNLFLVSGKPVEDRLHASNYCAVDLGLVPEDRSEQTRWFDEQVGRLEQSPMKQNLLLLHFENRLQDPAINQQKLALLERVMTVLNRTIVIVSMAPPGRFTAASTAGVPAAPVDAEQAEWMRRWAWVLSKFTVIPVVAATPALAQPAPGTALPDWITAGWHEILWRINALGFAHNAKFLDDEGRDDVVERLWKDVLPYAWHPDRPALTINQLLIEVGERAEDHYREIWESCTPAEKLVLGQIAEEGLVNQKTERTVRKLMARGLVRRQPNFVVINETFRQFVLSASSRAEVTALEGQATSTWDAIRWPFLILLIGSLTFFFATQHELFNTALGIVTGLAAALPALVKMASVFGDRREVQ